MTTSIKNSGGPDRINENLTDGILPPKPTKVKVPSREFKPWHKPRKHLIRIHQWQAEISNLIEEIEFDGRPLRYISLPGEDFLDVRTLHEVCESYNLPLRFLGFNDTADYNTDNTLVDPTVNEIVNLQWVDEKSRLAPDKFENLHIPKSMAAQYVDDTGPFDILNLDLCQSIATPLQRKLINTSPTYYDALLSLIQRQTIKRSEPWLFFLTTRCGPDNVNPDDIVKFWNCIENNMTSYQEFAELFNQLVNGKTGDALIFPDCSHDDQRLDFTNTFCVGLGKWLLQTAQSGSPRWKVQMLKSYHYQVRYPYDMLSVAFRFEQITIPPYDISGLSEVSKPNVNDPNLEALCAIEMIKTTSALQDADSLLLEDQGLRDEMNLKQLELLKKAGYSEELYFDWLRVHGLE
jgi:hypothetical protein